VTAAAGRAIVVVMVCTAARVAAAQTTITSAGAPAQLDVRPVGPMSIRVTLRPLAAAESLLATPGLAERQYLPPAISVRVLYGQTQARVGSLVVTVKANPLTVTAVNPRGERVQELVFEPDGTVSFPLDGDPVLGMGEGGPRPEQGPNWREQPVQFDRRGRLDEMEPRWQSGMYGSRNPVPMLVGTHGWALFVATPWVQVDLRNPARGVFLPWVPADSARAPQSTRNQGRDLNKGRPPVDAIVPGLFDIFLFDAHDPAAMMRDYSAVTGPAALPPRWAMGYMQSHRTIEDETQLLKIIDTFRSKQIPLDAVIYLGTGFAPRGWNTTQPSFTFNPDVFKRDPKTVIADMHARNVKVVVHIVPFDRDKLPTLHGSIPPRPGEVIDASHIASYWQQHVGLIDAGIDAFWPDEGDWFNLLERLERHRMYYEGPLSSRPNVRPWSLHRNGYPGIAQWGGWVWSGDTESSWKTLEAQIAVGLNYSLSISPFWGSDIGGFYPTRELTGELYARWFQFAAFTPSFRAHGRTWWMRLPWGWGSSDMGPREGNATNTPNSADERGIQLSSLNNPAIEPVVKRYDELRYQLLPYNYTLAWQARTTGLPLMRPLWLHYPTDAKARGLGSEYLWGRDLLIAPVFQQGATTRNVYLPQGTWYDWWTGARQNGSDTVTRAVDLATMPIFARAGAIVPFDPVRQYTAQPVTAPTEIRIYPGADGDYTLYDDDGTSQAYLAGVATYTRFIWDDRARALTIEPDSRWRSTAAAAAREFSVIVEPNGRHQSVHYAGARIRVAF
jgi:alpha-glucosidase (family GH31 glycosyl hydrolase)